MFVVMCCVERELCIVGAAKTYEEACVILKEDFDKCCEENEIILNEDGELEDGYCEDFGFEDDMAYITDCGLGHCNVDWGVGRVPDDNLPYRSY